MIVIIPYTHTHSAICKARTTRHVRRTITRSFTVLREDGARHACRNSFVVESTKALRFYARWTKRDLIGSKWLEGREHDVTPNDSIVRTSPTAVLRLLTTLITCSHTVRLPSFTPSLPYPSPSCFFLSLFLSQYLHSLISSIEVQTWART